MLFPIVNRAVFRNLITIDSFIRAFQPESPHEYQVFGNFVGSIRTRLRTKSFVAWISPPSLDRPARDRHTAATRQLLNEISQVPCEIHCRGGERVNFRALGW